MRVEGSAAKHTEIHTSLPLPSKVRQIDSLQVLRCVAVVLVTWAHTSLIPDPHVRLPDLGIFGIDIFFVISGFIMSSIVLHTSPENKTKEAGEFFRRRVIRIYPIYWIYALLGLLRYWRGHPMSWAYLPCFFLLPLPQYPFIFGLSWTMMFEMFFYTTMGLLMLVSIRRTVPLIIGVFTVAAVLGEWLHPSRPILRVLANPMVLEFVLGAAIALVFRRTGKRPRAGKMLVVAGVVVAVALRVYPPGVAESMQMILAGTAVMGRALTWGVAAALLVGGAVLWSPQVRSRTGLFFVVLGNSSYSAYLASTLVMEFTYRALLKVMPPTGPMGWSRTLFCELTMVSAVLIAGWVSYEFVEWPMVRYLQRATAHWGRGKGSLGLAPSRLGQRP